MKMCTLCDQDKPLDSFYQRKSGRYESRCKVCFSRVQQPGKVLREQANFENGNQLRLQRATKKCLRCGEVREYDNFDRSKKNKDGHVSSCKACSGPYSKVNYIKRREEKIARGEVTRLECLRAKRDYYGKYLNNHSCVDCGEEDILVLQADHLRDKVSNISTILGGNSGLDVLITELGKCDIRCANCHQKKTALDFNSWRILYV